MPASTSTVGLRDAAASRCWITTTASPRPAGRRPTSACSGSSPPDEAPIPTINLGVGMADFSYTDQGPSSSVGTLMIRGKLSCENRGPTPLSRQPCADRQPRQSAEPRPRTRLLPRGSVYFSTVRPLGASNRAALSTASSPNSNRNRQAYHTTKSLPGEGLREFHHQPRAGLLDLPAEEMGDLRRHRMPATPNLPRRTLSTCVPRRP